MRKGSLKQADILVGTPSTGDYTTQKCRGREIGIDRIIMMMIKIIHNLF